MQARLYQRPKHAMQSGHARTGEWLLEFERDDRMRADPLTGWTGSGFTAGQIQLRFASEAAALAYAQTNDLTVEIVRLAPKTLRIQAYSDNFR
ncbi:NADH dehydrogenase ubiquinone Fe-S protein 4 [Sandarakinorhabdus sp.]|uniref:NADH dehydrogenase ubiquinone Fe-S protein 4 n=1 Tax=Sandarakinorhabdus sp. TaxID=1916663 RepID=UPI00333E1C15